MINKRILLLLVPIVVVILGVTAYFIYCIHSFSIIPYGGTKRNRQELLAYFHENRDTLVVLTDELLRYESKGLVRIDDDWSSPDDLTSVGITSSKLTSLRKRLVALDIPRGVQCYNGSIKYLTYTYGLGISGGSDGLYYSPSTPQNYSKESLQSKPFASIEQTQYPSHGSFTVYTQIENNWYIYKSYED